MCYLGYTNENTHRIIRDALSLSPRNPLKDPAALLPDTRRLAMLGIATKGAERIATCDIELSMPPALLHH